ncbi:hypothetical protein C1645_747135 [Glomus cerebriforme]|uniref:Uncharacterized protein n=1 Tax=Glomus cerebriforme TaxID=658196 RepID=A0A397TSZ6_9GLOM|nr:hypothetical protein C1645_747135 [Glomus cerebriforme]
MLAKLVIMQVKFLVGVFISKGLISKWYGTIWTTVTLTKLHLYNDIHVKFCELKSLEYNLPN